MRQRGWTVGVLTEFWPDDKNLLGLNWHKGQKICLRLRYPYDERQFIPVEQVIDTMLHELCHIIHGPHNEAFHNLWNQLRDEQESLIRKGYTGEGFLSTGHKLGGARIPMHEARRRARAAAEKRRVLTAGSGQRLGGAPVRRDEDIRKVIADAATRRITVTKGCASGTERSRDLVEATSKNGFRTKAENEDANEEAIMQAYIEMIQEEEREKYGRDYIPPSKTNPGGSQGMAIMVDSDSDTEYEPEPTKTQSESTVRYSPATNTSAGSPQNTALVSRQPPGWSCEICTLDNPATFLICDACGTERPPSSLSAASATASSSATTLASSSRDRYSDKEKTGKASKSVKALSALSDVEKKKPLGWICHRCGNFMENEWWTCAGCGTLKLAS